MAPDQSSSIREYINKLYNLLEEQSASNAEKVLNALNYAGQVIPEQISVDDSQQITVMAINQLTNVQVKVDVPVWYLGDLKLHYNKKLVDDIQHATGSTATLFQKIPPGYLRIATNVRQQDGTRAVNTYIPDTSPVVQAIENGDQYVGKAFVVDNWYTTAYRPVYIDGEIKGMIYCGVKEATSQVEGFYFNNQHEKLIDILSLLFQSNPGAGEEVLNQLIHFSSDEKKEDDNSKLLNLGLRQLIVLLIQARSRQNLLTDPKDQQVFHRLQNIAAYIRGNLEQDIHINELANQAHMSQSTFFRLFKQQYGQTPTEFINKERIERARRLLREEGKSVTDVCYEVGYNNTSYFIQQFKQRYGVTPKQFCMENKHIA